MNPLGVRSLASRTLTALAVVATLLALVAGYLRHAVVDADQFADRATDALNDRSVRELVAAKVTDAVVAHEPDLVAARPILESVAADVIGTRAFANVFRSGARDVHRALLTGEEESLTLAASDVGIVLSAALSKVRPSLAKKLDDSQATTILSRGGNGGAAGVIVRAVDAIPAAEFLLGLLALILATLALVASPDRRRTVAAFGAGLVGAGLLLAVGLAVARGYLTGRVTGADEQAAAGAVWDAFLGDLQTAGEVLAGIGAVIAATAASYLKSIDVSESLRAAAHWISREPERPGLRVLRAVTLVVAGVVVIINPTEVVRLAVIAAGLYAVYVGLTAFLCIVYRPPAPGEHDRLPAAPLARRVAVPVIAFLVIVGGVMLFTASGGTGPVAKLTGACNGSKDLCDRRLDEVVLPATHNSMSAPLPGWFSSEQEKPIRGQLDDGIRGLLIDTHYGDLLSNGRVRTVVESRDKLREQARQDGVNPDAIDAAFRIRDRLGFRGTGRRGMFLCHSFCELGATRLQPELSEIHDFLVTNPGEVVVVINQDYVTPRDFVSAVGAAGLGEMAYDGPVDGEWPTLGELVKTNKRVVFLAERNAGAAPWYRRVYERAVNETPYSFRRVAQLTDPAQLATSCRPNRGPEKAPLFLLNHWITTDPLPKPSDAKKVNAHDALIARVRECERIRGHISNLIAVNFYRQGDLFKVVDELNDK